MSIIIKDLCHVYGKGTPFEDVAISGINLNIAPGEFIGLIGHTGSGKSTLIQHINGLLKPTSGSIFVDDKDVCDKKSVLDVRRKVGLVFQYPEYQLFEETVFKDIAFGPTNLGFDEQEIEQAVRYSMELVELDFDEFADKSPFELSGGQKRRVAIAGVLAMKPTTIILDEPTSGLDPLGSKNILSMIKNFHDSEHTVIMVSHNMDEVVSIAGRIIVISDGKIVFDDNPVNVFGHTKELLEIGLDVPTACRIAFEMRKQGVDVPNHILSIEELATWIKEKK